MMAKAGRQEFPVRANCSCPRNSLLRRLWTAITSPIAPWNGADCRSPASGPCKRAIGGTVTTAGGGASDRPNMSAAAADCTQRGEKPTNSNRITTKRAAIASPGLNHMQPQRRLLKRDALNLHHASVFSYVPSPGVPSGHLAAAAMAASHRASHLTHDALTADFDHFRSDRAEIDHMLLVVNDPRPAGRRAVAFDARRLALAGPTST